MKVIRKSDMLRNCQEGHLRAERDFLVAAEGSRWLVSSLIPHCIQLIYLGSFLSLQVSKT
jgi:hypothetical protein